jgi:hypothetical protein
VVSSKHELYVYSDFSRFITLIPVCSCFKTQCLSLSLKFQKAEMYFCKIVANKSYLHMCAHFILLQHNTFFRKKVIRVNKTFSGNQKTLFLFCETGNNLVNNRRQCAQSIW